MKNANRLGLLVAALLAASTAYAQSPSSERVVVLPKDARGLGVTIGMPPRDVTVTVAHMNGWLLCNGARARKSLYSALAAATHANPANQDPDPAYFRLCSRPMKFKHGKLYKGWAINPFPPYQGGAVIGVLQPFEIVPSI